MWAPSGGLVPRVPPAVQVPYGAGKEGSSAKFAPLAAGVPNGEITTVAESQMIRSQPRSPQPAAGPQGPRRPEPSPATARRSAHRCPRRARLTLRRGLGRRRRDGRRGAGGRPGHGPGPARRRRRRRRRFVSRAAGQAQPRESADRPKGGGSGRPVGEPRAHPFNPPRAARPAFAPPPRWRGPVAPPPKPLLKDPRRVHESSAPSQRAPAGKSRRQIRPQKTIGVQGGTAH